MNYSKINPYRLRPLPNPTISITYLDKNAYV